MFWLDYTVQSFPNGDFTVEGDWPKEVMGYDKDGNPGNKPRPLYQPGDVFMVNEDGWLIKTDEVNALLIKHESSKALLDRLK